MEKAFRIDGLDCANCAAKAERAVSKLDKVNKVSINFLTGKMLLAADDDVFEQVCEQAVATIKKFEPQVTVRRI